jgi:hypothetical protein
MGEKEICNSVGFIRKNARAQERERKKEGEGRREGRALKVLE